MVMQKLSLQERDINKGDFYNSELTGRSYFQAVNYGIESHQELVCKIISNTNQSYKYSLAYHFDMPEHGICIKKLIQKMQNSC